MNLAIEDTREAKFALIDSLADRLDLLPPVYIISHNRSGTLRTLATLPYLQEHATVVVREQEIPEYRAAWPKVNLAAIPPGYGGHDGGIGRARQFCIESASILGQDRMMILDDDLISLTILYPRATGGASHAYESYVTDKVRFRHGVLVLASLLGEEAAVAMPNAVIATPQCNNASRTVGSSSVRWEASGGGNPSQFQYWCVDRYEDLCGGWMDLEHFNFHGEDISIALQVIENEGVIVDIPSILGHYLDYETQSVMRTPETAPGLRQHEHDELMAHPLARFVKTRTDFLDRPQWHSLDWRALKAAGMAPTASRRWEEPSLLPESFSR